MAKEDMIEMAGVVNEVLPDTRFRVALENGGSSDGEPGPRPDYNPNYYGAFVRDPDGNKLEAVTYSAV